VKASPTLVLPTWIADEIASVARERNEAGAVLLAGVATTESGLRLLGRELVWVPDESYERRTPRSLSIRSSGYVRALARAAGRGDVPIWLHTHPGRCADPTRSEYDEVVDDELRETFRIRADVDLYASIVVSPNDRAFRFTATVWNRDEEPVQIERMLVVGDRFALHSSDDAATGGRVPDHFDRQIRAFGGDVQRVLASLSIAVVGCGGTGSATAEQLARLGVGSLLLVDHDVLSESNVTRVYGSSPYDIGRPKVDVLGDHLRRIAPTTEVTTIRGTINDLSVARALTGRDLVYGCTDDNAGRLVLSRLASYYLTPVIDVGVLLSSEDGSLRGIDGRVTVLTPGTACLVCRNRIDLPRAAAEQLSEDERATRTAEGYAPELAGVEPAVVAYTSAVASFAVAELLERLIGYGPEPAPSEFLLRYHDREISTNRVAPKPRHYCNPETGLLGSGDREPFLGQTWASK
jgi:molybdopterin/thiamine biosynthesis adenylyltransferase